MNHLKYTASLIVSLISSNSFSQNKSVTKDIMGVNSLVVRYSKTLEFKEITGYKNGARHGVYKSFHENGELFFLVEYEMGLIKDGTYFEYGVNGIVSRTLKYKNGKENSRLLTFDLEGREWKIYVFKNGVLKKLLIKMVNGREQGY